MLVILPADLRAKFHDGFGFRTDYREEEGKKKGRRKKVGFEKWRKEYKAKCCVCIL